MWPESLGFQDSAESSGLAEGNTTDLVQITGLAEPGPGLSRAGRSAELGGKVEWMRKVSACTRDSETSSEITLCEIFSHLLSYPDEDYKEWVESCAGGLDEPARAIFQSFAEVARGEPLARLEENFVATFEMTRKRPLEIGWHLYGEQYKRGEFLVRMRKLLRDHGVEENHELPDHLSHCLVLLPRMEGSDAAAFVVGYLLPAIEKLLKGFQTENPYQQVLLTLQHLLSQPAGRSERDQGGDA